MLNKKLIFLDIDGTLTEPGRNTPPVSALDAIRRARQAGHKVFLCTGRTYAMLSPLLPYGFDGLIASSGGYVEIDGRTIYDHPMTADQRDRISQVLAENRIFRTIECKDGSYTDEGFKDFLRENSTEGGNSELLRWREQIEQSLGILPMQDYDGQLPYKFIMMATSPASVEAAKASLGSEFTYCVQEPDATGITNGEIICPEYDKGQAVVRVCEALGYPVEASIGFGDSMNDLEMMETVGIGVCMENGSTGLKKLADMICPAYDKDGLFLAFEELGLFEE